MISWRTCAGVRVTARVEWFYMLLRDLSSLTPEGLQYWICWIIQKQENKRNIVLENTSPKMFEINVLKTLINIEEYLRLYSREYFTIFKTYLRTIKILFCLIFEKNLLINSRILKDVYDNNLYIYYLFPLCIPVYLCLESCTASYSYHIISCKWICMKDILFSNFWFPIVIFSCFQFFFSSTALHYSSFK